MSTPLDTPLSRLRLERGLTQADLAALSGLDQATVARLETGKVSPKASTIMAVAEALDIEPVDYFRVICGMTMGLISTRQLLDAPNCNGIGEAKVSGK